MGVNEECCHQEKGGVSHHPLELLHGIVVKDKIYMAYDYKVLCSSIVGYAEQITTRFFLTNFVTWLHQAEIYLVIGDGNAGLDATINLADSKNSICTYAHGKYFSDVLTPICNFWWQ